METLALFGIAVAVTGVIVLIIAGTFIIFDMWNDRCAKQASNEKLLLAKERERIVLRLHRNYCRKLLSEDNKLIYKDEVLDHLVCVLQIYDAYLPHKPSVSHDLHPAGGLGTTFSGGETAPHETVGK